MCVKTKQVKKLIVLIMPINGPILIHWSDPVRPNLAILFCGHTGEKTRQTGSERTSARPMKKTGSMNR